MLLHGPVTARIAVYAPVQIHEGGVPVGEGVVPDGVETASFGYGGGDDVDGLLMADVVDLFFFFVSVRDKTGW